MSRKYLSLLFVPLLASCTLTGTPTDFTGMYNSHVKSQVESLREVGKDLGIGQKYAIDGSTKIAASIPGFMNGVLSGDYSSKVDGKNVEFTARNLLLSYEALIASGSISLDTLGITSHEGDAYFLLKDLKQSNMLSDAMMGVIQKYNNVWLALTKEDMKDSFSGATATDALSYKISESLSSLTLEEIEGYLVKYPVLQETKDLGMSGTIQSYEVMINTPNIVSLVDVFSNRLTGSGMTDEEKKTLSEDLASLQGTGVVSYNPKNPKYFDMQLAVTAKQGESTKIALHQDIDAFSLVATTGVNAVSISSEKSPTGDKNLTLSMSQDGTEVGKLIAVLKYDEKRLAEMTVTLSSPAQGFTVTMNHKNAKDGSFEGNMNFGVGSATWTGKVLEKTLTALHIHGAVIGNTLALDLEKGDDDMLHGPLVVKSGNTESFSADMGLRLTPERFSVTLDMAIPTGEPGTADAPKAHFEADIIAKRSDFSGKIKVPSESKPFKEFIDAMSALAPTESFVEEDSGSAMLPEAGFSESNN